MSSQKNVGGGREAISCLMEKKEENSKKRKLMAQEKLEKKLSLLTGKFCLLLLSNINFTNVNFIYYYTDKLPKRLKQVILPSAPNYHDRIVCS